ncbi:MAG: ABC transporter permease subunit, partial [Verrucomicrobiales bacterium]|nr:ABC transporter permease subunit [Verrucomicrobiales bacterium]
MKLLPVAERELRVASRRRGTYWIRFGAAALAIAAAALTLMATTRLRPADQSQILFVTLSVFAFAYCMLGGVLSTSDCVSEERRDGTLGLLFLTNLRGYDVVVGKLAANSVRVILALVALLPVIALPVLMGGVSGRLVGMVVLVLGNTLFVSLAIGVMVSVWTHDARHSFGGALAFLTLWVGVLPLLRFLWLEYGVRPRFQGTPAELSAMMMWVLELNPVYVFLQVLEALGRGAMLWDEVWRGLAIQHGIGWVLLIAACWILPRSWRDRVEGERVAASTSAAVRDQRTATRRRWRGELLDWHPFAWMVAKDRRAGIHVWLGLAVVAGVWTWGFLEVREEWLAGLVALWTTFAAGL